MDDKNRLPIPSAVRKLMDPQTEGEAFFFVVVESRRPWLFTRRYYHEIASQAPVQALTGKQQRDADRRWYSLASLLEWDKQGRMLIPEQCIKRYPELGREVTLVGARNHLEIWNRQEWNTERERLLQDDMGPVG